MGRTREIARRSIHESDMIRLPRTSQIQKKKRSRKPPITIAVASSHSDSESSQDSGYEVQPASASASVVEPSHSHGFILSDPDVFNCPICIHPLTIPVYQCEDGHFSCHSCRDKIEEKCPTCSKPIGNKRSRGMEKVLESIKMSCKNMEHGCMKKVSFSKKLDHENSCIYTPAPCPLVGCKYVGAGNSFYDHCVEKHPYYCKFIAFDKVKSICAGYGLCFLLEEEEKTIFFLHRMVDPLGSFVCVSTASSMKFSYEITAGSGDMSVNMKSFVLIMPKHFAKPAKEKCLLVTNSIECDCDEDDDDDLMLPMLPLQLVVRKASL